MIPSRVTKNIVEKTRQFSRRLTSKLDLTNGFENFPKNNQKNYASIFHVVVHIKYLLYAQHWIFINIFQ